MRILYALLCYASIVQMALHAAYTTQKSVDVAWQASEHRWLHNVCQALAPNIDERIQEAQKEFVLPTAPIKKCSGEHYLAGGCAMSKRLVDAIEDDSFPKVASIAWWAYTTNQASCLTISYKSSLFAVKASPLCRAILHCRDTLSSFLTHCGASPNQSTYTLQEWNHSCHEVGRALPLAVGQNNSTIALLLLQHGASITRHQAWPDISALQKVLYASYTCIAQRHDMLELLLRYRLLPQGASKFEQEAHDYELYERNPLLHYAFKYGDVEALKILLEAGIDPNRLHRGTSLYPLDVVCQITCPHEHDKKIHKKLIKHMCKILFKHGATQCCKPHPLADEALDELIEKYEIELGIKGETCV